MEAAKAFGRPIRAPNRSPTAHPSKYHYLIDLLAFVSKGCSRFLPRRLDSVSHKSEGESASIGADIGGVLQGETSCDCADVWLSPW